MFTIIDNTGTGKSEFPWAEKFKETKADNCLHNTCQDCKGTGIKQNGGPCVHYLSCPCPKCTVRY